MRPPSSPAHRIPRRATAALAVGAVAAGCLALAPLPVFAEEAAASVVIDKLGDHDRDLIASYRSMSRSRTALPGTEQPVPDYVTLMFAVEAGTAQSTADELTALGGQVTGIQAELGYVKANLPFAAVDSAVALAGVLRVDADEVLTLEDTSVDSHAGGHGDAPDGQTLPSAPTAETPDDNPYMPTNDMGSVDFKVSNPDFDGRGVTIGIVDTGIDPTHPALTTTTTGEAKLVDTVTGTNPLNLIDLLTDRTWSLLSDANRVTGETGVRQGVTFTMPEGGREEYFLTSKLLELSTFVDPTLSGVLGTAYRERDNSVWIDLNQDHVFADDERIEPFAVSRDIRYLGTDDPATAQNERQPFTVEARRLSSTLLGVNINTIDASHGSHVAGITAAHGILGGAMDGQAPGAKLVSMKACGASACSSAALTDGVVALATNHGVDVINISIGSAPALNDGQSAMALLWDRVIEETGVQIFSSAGNSGAGVNTVGDPSSSSSTVSVGASVTDETWWSNYGSFVKDRESIFPFSSRGPREDGGLKPDIVAPGSAVGPTPLTLPAGSVVSTGYELPVGYGMLQGTSMASPQAAGAAALLLSAAKQRGIEVTPAQLRTAIFSSADLLDDEPATAQGHGKFDVPAAWNLLSKRDGTEVDRIEVSAPVCTTLSSSLVTPNAGAGLYNDCAASSGGQAVGESRAYQVTLTRTSGSDRDTRYHLAIDGDRDVFSAPRFVTLPKGVPTVVEVTARPQTEGLASALLRIDDPRTKAVDRTVMLAVGVGTPLTVDAAFATAGSVDRNDTVSYLVTVPEGASALTVNLAGVVGDSQVRWTAYRADGTSGERSSFSGTLYCYANLDDGAGCDPYTRTYTRPQAGVWELVVEARRTSPELANPYELGAVVTLP